MKQKLLIIGAGNVAKFIAYNINQFTASYEIIGFLDDDSSKLGNTIAGYQVLGSIERLNEFSGKGIAVVLGITFPVVKSKIKALYDHLVFDFPNLISKTSWISNGVLLGEGCIIYPGVCINFESEIKDFVVINMNCSIGHSCKLDSYVSIAPGAQLGGGTYLKRGVEFGIGASTIPNIEVGENSIIGGQTMLIENIEENKMAAGVPARVKKSLS
jgi:sugar O-acyltransferase (sialic acid O-acetyltransferase NeuD family)